MIPLQKQNGSLKGKIGIIAGAGPEAGVDLWQKILLANKRLLGQNFEGDLDAPNVTIFSVPELGLAMNINKHEEALWNTLKTTLISISDHVDHICIACNVLHHYGHKIKGLNMSAELVSVVDVVRDYIIKNQIESVALLSISTVVELGKWSAYAPLKDIVSIETPKDPLEINKLVGEIKKSGASSAQVKNDFHAIIKGLNSEIVFLACTELPLIPITVPDKILIDVTQLLAEEIINRSLHFHD